MTVGEYSQQFATDLNKAINHVSLPGDLKPRRGWPPRTPPINSFLDPAIQVNRVRWAEDEMIGISRVEPDRPTVAVIEAYPSFSAIGRAIKPTAGRGKDQVG